MTIEGYEELLEAIGQLDIDAEEFIKDAAMSRCRVKLSRRPHIRSVLDEAFKLARERYDSYRKASREVGGSNG